MTVIGIDPGTSCGWAVLSDDGKRIASGVWNLSPGRHEGGGMRFLRLERYMREVIGNLEHSAGLVVAYEEVRRHMGTDAAHIYGGVVATITRICEQEGIPYRGVPVGTVKKTATGKGNADKALMMTTAVMRWESGFSSDEADALWVAETLRREVRCEPASAP